MNRLETFCPLWPELDGDGLRATRAQQSVWAAQRETATRGSGGGKLKRAADGSEVRLTRQSGETSFGWKMGRIEKKKPNLKPIEANESERSEGGNVSATSLPPSAEAPRSATLNLLFHAPRHKPPSRASINKQALCCSLSAWSVIIANGWGKKKRSDTGSRGEALPKYGLNQMAFHFQWELITRRCRGLWVYWSLRSSCFLHVHAALNSFLLSA